MEMGTLSCTPTPVRISVSSFEAQEDDKWLLARVAAHDPEAFETLYARYAPSLRSYLSRHLQEYDLIEEVFNDVMLVLWQRADRLPDQVAPVSWLYSIAKNKAGKARRCASRPAPASSPLAEREKFSLESGMLRREQRQTVASVVDTLPPAQRTVIEMLVYEGRSYKDIAAQTGESISTVKTRIGRVRRRFAEQVH